GSSRVLVGSVCGSPRLDGGFIFFFFKQKTAYEIEVDVGARRIHLHVSDAELGTRRAAWKAPAPRYPRGYGAMFSEHIGQADEGCDFDFLGAAGTVMEPEIH